LSSSNLDLLFWEPCLSPHKSALCNALAASGRVSSVTYVAQTGLPQDKRAQGWSLPHLDAVVIVSPDASRVREIVASSKPDAVHIFSGVHWTPIIVEGLRCVIKMRRRFGLLCEPRAFEGAKGWARFVHSWLTEAGVRRNVDFVLAIGRNGPSWFRAVGYKQAQIFPFAYFLPAASASCELGLRGGPPVVAFVGRLNKEKGLPLFLDALRLLNEAVRVEIVGAGSEEANIRAFAADAPMPLRFLGTLAMDDVPKFMSSVDVLVLPSITKNDGWGAVVSEALLAGASVVASDRVGASICLDADWRGCVVHDLTARGIAQAIDSAVTLQLSSSALRERRSRWAHSRLTGEAGARHLLEILGHVYEGGSRPEPFYAGD